MALIHGGQLQQVAQEYNIPVEQWLDLSTGIAPTSYPIPNIPNSAWQQLPQHNVELIDAAKQYYQCSKLIVTNGSQAVIKALPDLYKKQNLQAKHVYLPQRGYREHALAWQLAGYQLHFYQDDLPDVKSLSQGSVLVIINPNNPTGQFFSKKTIGHYHEALTNLNGLLVVDEAFIDVMPNNESYSPLVNNGHCLVLRSFGKFFGLAGIRIGFTILNDHWFNLLNDEFGPWQVNGPAQIIAKHALMDFAWHSTQKNKLNKLKSAQEDMFKRIFTDDILLDISGCDLFITLCFNNSIQAEKTIAFYLYDFLCKQGVYCRLSDEQDTLRFGITKADKLKHLELALSKATKQLKHLIF